MKSRRYRFSCARWISLLVGFTAGLCLAMGLAITVKLTHPYSDMSLGTSKYLDRTAM